MVDCNCTDYFVSTVAAVVDSMDHFVMVVPIMAVCLHYTLAVKQELHSFHIHMN